MERGVRLSLALALSPRAAWASALGWVTSSHTNCYSNDLEGYVGGSIISADTNPLSSEVSLSHCMALCEAHERCDGIVMLDEKPTQCFLRGDVKPDKCSFSEARFNFFEKPGAMVGKKLTTFAKALESIARQWVTYSSTNCYPGHGAELVMSDAEMLPRRLDLSMCQRLCVRYAECEAIVWRDRRGADEPSCGLRSTVNLRECRHDDADYDLIVLHRPEGPVLVAPHTNPTPAPTTTAAPTPGPTPAPTTSTTEPATTATTTPAPTSSTEPATTTTAQPSTTTTTHEAAPMGNTTTSTPLGYSAFLREGLDGPWRTKAHARCGDPMGSPGYDPVPGYNSIMECMGLCGALPECEAVNMLSTHVDTQVCWLRTNVNVTGCTDDRHFVTWAKPDETSTRTLARQWWYSFGGKVCDPGSGAEFAVEGQDVHPTAVSINACEELCSLTPECQGISYFFTDQPVPNCHLRKAIDVTKCEDDPAFEIRIKPEVVERIIPMEQRWDAAADVPPVPRATPAWAQLGLCALVASGAYAVAQRCGSRRGPPEELAEREDGEVEVGVHLLE